MDCDISGVAASMVIPQCIAILHTKCGEMHFYDLTALRVALAAVACSTDNAQTPALPVSAAPSLHEGFTIEQWVKYGKLKAKIASDVCRTNDKLKNRLGRINAVYTSSSGVDELFDNDPWTAAHTGEDSHDVKSVKSSPHGAKSAVRKRARKDYQFHPFESKRHTNIDKTTQVRVAQKARPASEREKITY